MSAEFLRDAVNDFEDLGLPPEAASNRPYTQMGMG
jgi:hypothetical protein